jgi:hypothetical protein
MHYCDVFILELPKILGCLICDSFKLFTSLDIKTARNMVNLLIYGAFALLTFVINSTFLILYFSTVISYDPSKLTLHKEAFKIALPGTFLITVCIFLDPLLPSARAGLFLSPINIGIISSIILWAVLTRHYCEIEWLSTIIVSFVAAMMYALIWLFIGGFLFLTMSV